MKKIFFFLFFIFYGYGFSQDWHKTAKSTTYKYTPRQQFIIDQYRNDLWFVSYYNVLKIKDSGQIIEYMESEIGEISPFLNLSFTFSLNNIYFCRDKDGLFKLQNNVAELQFPLSTSYHRLRNNLDTIYVTRPSLPYVKYINGQNLNNTYGGTNILTKGKFLYPSGLNSSLIKFTGPGLTDFEYYSLVDTEYICPQFNDIKFSRHTDTLYVACEKGISFAYNYDFLDTITPFNTSNMPSANVLEMEFDHLDRLWAIFGDSDDKPFALAMFENQEWINYYDKDNSPIQFDAPMDINYYLQMEIDTLGNVWVCDKDFLYLLKSPSNPDWVLDLEHKEISSFKQFPNPTKENLHLTWNIGGNTKIRFLDLTGKEIMYKEVQGNSFDLDLKQVQSGIYFIEWQQGERIERKKVVKQ